MHLFPLIAIPLVLIVYFTYKQLGMNSEVPIQPQARVDYWASHAVVVIRQLLSGAQFGSVADDQLIFLAKQKEGRLSSRGGALFLTQESEEEESELCLLGSEGLVHFALTPSYLVVHVVAGQDGFSKELQVRIPNDPHNLDTSCSTAVHSQQASSQSV